MHFIITTSGFLRERLDRVALQPDMPMTESNMLLNIPPRPEAMTVLREELSNAYPDLRRVSRSIKADVALSAAMLKTVNSPAFGLRTRARSVAEAIDYLGLRQASAIATGLALRQVVGNGPPVTLHRFWDTAEKVALYCAVIAKRLRGIPVEEAYTYGLFHDCGIAILLKHHRYYQDVLKRANNAEEDFTAIEQREVGLNHALLGSRLAQSWQLSDVMSQAILLHHDIGTFHDAEILDGVLGLIAVGHLAQHIHHQQMRGAVDLEWAKFEHLVFGYLSLDGEEYLNLMDLTQDALADGDCP